MGFGLDLLYAKAELDQNVDATNLIYVFDPNQGIVPLFNGDITVRNVAHDWGVGWHAGLLWKPTTTTDVGVSYHSRINMDLRGDRTIGLQNALNPLSGGAAAAIGLVDSSVDAPLTLPDYETLSIKQYIFPWWDIVGDITHVQWSELKNITLNFGPNLPNAVSVLNYRNTWRIALGQEFQVNSWWKLRMGVAFDETPINSQFIDARLPDGNRIWLLLVQTLSLIIGWIWIFLMLISS